LLGVRHQVTPLASLELLDRTQQQLFLLGPQPPKFPNLPGSGSLLEFVERSNVERVVDQRDRLGTDALKFEQLQHGGGIVGHQLAMVGQLTRLDELANSCGEIFPNARQGPQLLLVQVSDPLRRMEDEVRGVAVRSNLERVGPLDLKHIRDFAEDLRNRAIVHGLNDHEEHEESTTKGTKS
jgi:hypothetical protein